MSFVCNLLCQILQNKRSSGRKRNRTQAGLIVQSKDHANAISGRYEAEQIEAILLLKLLTSEGSNLSKEKSLPFSVSIIGCRIVRKPFADFVGAFIYFHFTERPSHPPRGGKPEFKKERYPPLDGAACSAFLLLLWYSRLFSFNQSADDSSLSRLAYSTVTREDSSSNMNLHSLYPSGLE